MVRNGIPRVYSYFWSTERNSELFSLPLKSSEGNSESLLLFWFHGTEFRVVFSSAEVVSFYFCSTERNSLMLSLPRNGSEWNSESFLFHGTAAIPWEITICSVYSVFRGIIVLSEIPNPRSSAPLHMLCLSQISLSISSFFHQGLKGTFSAIAQ